MTQRIVLTSRWRLDTPAAAVWRLLTDVEAWPRWWRYVRRVRVVSRAATTPVGDIAEIDWASALYYGLRLRVTTAVAEHARLLEGHASGDLRGVGAWILEPVDDGGVDVTYRWEVALQWRWMRALAFALMPLFEWSHFVVMRSGAQGMARVLGCRLSHCTEWVGTRRR
jgi:uncharacterized protein YndB with AHSA1/START domain